MPGLNLNMSDRFNESSVMECLFVCNPTTLGSEDGMRVMT
jgi:hypothetical protein